MHKNLKAAFVSTLLSLSFCLAATAADSTPAAGANIPDYLKKYLPAYFLTGTDTADSSTSAGAPGASTDSETAVNPGTSSAPALQSTSTGGSNATDNTSSSNSMAVKVGGSVPKKTVPVGGGKIVSGGGTNIKKPVAATKNGARPMLHVLPKAFKPNSQGAGPGGGYSVQQIRHAYSFDMYGGNGAGQVITIIDAYGNPNIQYDLEQFCIKFGINPTAVKISYPQGQPINSDSGWADETSLDVEWAHAMAPGAQIWLIVTNPDDPSFALSVDPVGDSLFGGVDYAVQNGARIVSMSWGALENGNNTPLDAHFNKAGVTFLASTGDSGAGVSYPSVSPYVTAVGGTTLNLDLFGTVKSESAWAYNATYGWGGGGGLSAFESEPGYQSGFQHTGLRAVPDVAYNADPLTGFSVFNSSFGVGWEVLGGTSAGTPQWAALVALASSSKPITNLNLRLYLMSLYDWPGFFNDVIGGDINGITAISGYDQATGLGSPRAYAIALLLGAY